MTEWCNTIHVKKKDFYKTIFRKFSGLNQKDMKTYIQRTILLLFVLVGFASCEAIGDIFQAGMSVGIFLVILVIAVIIWIISKVRK